MGTYSKPRMCEYMSELQVNDIVLPEDFSTAPRSRISGGGQWAKIINDLLASKKPNAGKTVSITEHPADANPESEFMKRAKSIRGIVSKAAKDAHATVRATIALNGMAGSKQIAPTGFNGVVVFGARKLTDAEFKEHYGEPKPKAEKPKAQGSQSAKGK